MGHRKRLHASWYDYSHFDRKAVLGYVLGLRLAFGAG
jgi:hypothetical protein